MCINLYSYYSNTTKLNSKKGHRYSFFKQNVAHLASTSLQQQNESNNEQQTRLKNSTTTTPATSRNRIEYELVDKPNLTKTISPSILSTVSSQSTLANNLQYGEVFIRCTCLN